VREIDGIVKVVEEWETIQQRRDVSMGARMGATKIAIKRNGKRIGVLIERVLFAASAVKNSDKDYPRAIGFVNYKRPKCEGAIFPVYSDESGPFIEQTDAPIFAGYPLGAWGFGGR
jgi:hypothetical protein